MDDDDTTTGTGTGDGEGDTGSGGSTESSTGTGGTSASAGSESQSESQTDGDLPDWAKAKIATANREAAKFRKERNDAQKKLDDAQAATLSEQEREKKRADDAETALSSAMSRVRESNLRVAIASAEGVNVVDVETAALLLTKQGITFDDEGEPQEIATALDTLVKAKPFLVGTVTAPANKGGTNGGAGGSEGNEGGVNLTAEELTIAKAFKMTPEEYAKNKNRK